MQITSLETELNDLWAEAHELAQDAPYWDVLQASERAAAAYGQLRRGGANRERAELFAVSQFTVELLTHDQLSGTRLTLAGIRRGPERALDLLDPGAF